MSAFTIVVIAEVVLLGLIAFMEYVERWDARQQQRPSDEIQAEFSMLLAEKRERLRRD